MCVYVYVICIYILCTHISYVYFCGMISCFNAHSKVHNTNSNNVILRFCHI